MSNYIFWMILTAFSALFWRRACNRNFDMVKFRLGIEQAAVFYLYAFLEYVYKTAFVIILAVFAWNELP